MGYFRAGFDMTGVDVRPMPNYPFAFVQADALEYVVEHAHEFAFIAASPPCQRYSVTASLHANEYPDLVGPTRELLRATGLPYVMENVQGAPLGNYVTLCGSSFGLGVRRHRLFETNWMVWNPPACRHDLQPEPIDVTGTGGPCDKPNPSGGIHRKPRNLAHARYVMGIDWMTRSELSEAIPPAYTEFIGSQLLASLASDPR